jgi:ABC-type multidrug transport system fused ATPase/permease subunit
MVKVYKNLWSLFSIKEQGQALLLLVTVTLVAVVDVLGIASLFPFLTVVLNKSLIETNFFLSEIYIILGFRNTEDFLLCLGVFIFLIFILSQALKILVVYLQFHFSLMREFSISKKLLSKYLSQEYQWHLNNNSSNLSTKLLSEVNQVVYQVIIPTIILISNSIVAILIFLVLLWADPRLAITVCFILSFSYFIIYQLVKKHISKWGIERHESNLKRFRAASDVFSVIKDVKLHSLEKFYISQYESSAYIFAKRQASSNSAAQIPRYVLEVIAFGGMFFVILYSMALNKGLIESLPILALYGFAGYRLMPAMQLIYVSLSQIKFANYSLVELAEDFKLDNKDFLKNTHSKNKITLKKEIAINNLSFGYSGGRKKIIKKINLLIKANRTTGIVGESGSGKTTLIDIIMGLYSPDSGGINVDNILIDHHNIKDWQSIIGYVPQQIHLLDDTIANNIALGLDSNLINQFEIEEAAKIANLHNFIMTLPNRYETIVGDRGVKLSGGQRQRIGIARALYRKPKILVLDEATSALDNLTEFAVMDAVQKLSHKLTIIIVAHRLTTLKSCDQIIFMDSGRIADIGTYQSMVKRNANFKSMVKHENITYD